LDYDEAARRLRAAGYHEPPVRNVYREILQHPVMTAVTEAFGKVEVLDIRLSPRLEAPLAPRLGR